MMRAHASAGTRKPAGFFDRHGLLSQLISVLLAWAMVMSSLPAYATGHARVKWVLDRGRDAASTATWPQTVTPERSPKGHKLDGASLSGRKQRKERAGAGRMQLASLKPPAGLANSHALSSLKTSAGLASTHALLQSAIPGESSIVSNFNGTAVPGGSFLWFSSVFKASGLGSQPVRVFLRAASVQFTAAGVTTRPTMTTTAMGD